MYNACIYIYVYIYGWNDVKGENTEKKKIKLRTRLCRPKCGARAHAGGCTHFISNLSSGVVFNEEDSSPYIYHYSFFEFFAYASIILCIRYTYRYIFSEII